MDNILLISYVSNIYSRLSYLDPIEFNIYYSNIFSSNNTYLYPLLSLLKSDKRNLDTIYIDKLQYINKFINGILYSKQTLIKYKDYKDYKFFSISNSNYSSTFITANKLMNTITISFRGTYSLKSGLSYAKLSSIKPYILCKKEGVLEGIFKIVNEMYNTIIESIDNLKSKFLMMDPSIVTTGHSLGGACATIFSYLYQLNKKKKIYCITFGAPRVFNYELINIYNSYILKNKIIFYRYVTNGDPFATLPPNIKILTTTTFFHPDDHNSKLENVAYRCNFKTKKTRCSLKSKTKKRKLNTKYHGNYLGISYKNAANNLKDLNKEIKRNKYNETIVRLCESKCKNIECVFYNQEYLKREDFENKTKIKKIIIKLSKQIKSYLVGDIFMNKKQFSYLINNMRSMDTNLLSTENYTIPLINQTPNKIIDCQNQK